MVAWVQQSWDRAVAIALVYNRPPFSRWLMLSSFCMVDLTEGFCDVPMLLTFCFADKEQAEVDGSEKASGLLNLSGFLQHFYWLVMGFRISPDSSKHL